MYITVHRQAILLLVVESGTYDVICQFCTVKGMVVESEVLKAQNYALSKFSLPMHSNVESMSFPNDCGNDLFQLEKK